MNAIYGFILAGLLASVTAYAHGGSEHIQGTVTAINAKAITVQSANKTTKTVTVTEHSTFVKSGKRASLRAHVRIVR